MQTFADKYKGEYQGSLESIPELTKEAKERRNELKQRIREDRFLIVTTNYDALIRIGSFIHAANVMKEAVEVDNIDDVNQNKKAFQCMDVVMGMLKEAGISIEQYLRGEF